ncbi:MAG TPA: ATP-binding protein [Pyrinomonadaceae bacterium]|jgi:two-component system sensor histidine kinase PilS (NtrC family)|nr:ATP-binding protein [Pyrinomonadaceae bacterium]
MTVGKHKAEPFETLGARLWWLITGRLLGGIFLLWAGSLWTRGNLRGHGPWRSPLTIFLALGALTIVYALARRFSRAVVLQTRVQFLIDILLVTWLVWLTNDAHSPYTALYIVIISLASIFLGPRDAIITSVMCAVAFTACAFAVITGIGPSGTQAVRDNSLSETIQTVGLFDIAFFVVGLLSAKLAQRQSRSDVRLIAATQTLAHLRALHERIVESIRSGVVTTDLQGRIYTFNTAAQEITGYQEKDVYGQEASILFGDIGEDIAQSLRAPNTGGPSPRFEANCLTAEGLRLRLGFSISPLFSEAGETTGAVITFQDLTQIRALEETSRRQDRLAAIGRMAASIAHEIRNPLAAMRGSIQMLRSEMKADSAQGELMEIILRESDRLNRIISDFLNYARPRSIVLAPIDVCELLHDTFTLMRHSPEIGPDHVLEEELPGEPLLAQVDAEQLRQVFWNLSRNAFQAMPKGGILQASMNRNSHGRMQITFSDNGCGMSPEQVERLFEPFSSTTGGSGLGLSIVYQIIRDHGGTINVRSREGQGTSISIELPRGVEESRTSSG